MLSGICRVCSTKTCGVSSPAGGTRVNEPLGKREGLREGASELKVSYFGWGAQEKGFW